MYMVIWGRGTDLLVDPFLWPGGGIQTHWFVLLLDQGGAGGFPDRRRALHQWRGRGSWRLGLL